VLKVREEEEKKRRKKRRLVIFLLFFTKMPKSRALCGAKCDDVRRGCVAILLERKVRLPLCLSERRRKLIFSSFFFFHPKHTKSAPLSLQIRDQSCGSEQRYKEQFLK